MYIYGSLAMVIAALSLFVIALLRGYKPFAGPTRGADLVGAPASAIRTLEKERMDSVRSLDSMNMALLISSILCFVTALVLAAF